MVVATHDVEFAAGFADRVVLLGDGVAIADAETGEVLSGGWYFATEVARILDLPGRRHPRAGGRPPARSMSWELASFLILGGVLLAGFAWYERSRPPSQVVALVAALAALAIAGRIAFAAFPNVKPTTDIVILAGYALGPAPGFAVGALTALVSNLWFGQGPWTPWQMAGWGLCGIYGAVLALLCGAEIGRLTLAAACGLAGVAYGALLNFSLMATYGGELSVQRFAALESRAIPFDLAHAIGNIVFALIAGPAMLRMLVRFRERFEWRARTPALAGTVLAALLLVSALPSQASGATGATGAADWLVSVQNSDGGWGSSPGSSSSASITSWVDARPRGRRPQPARHLEGRQDAGRLPALDDRRNRKQRRLRAHDPRPRGRRGRRPLLRRARPRQRCWPSAAAATAPGKGGRGPPRSRCSRCGPPATPAGSKSRSRGWPKSRTATAAGATNAASRAPPTTPAR